MKWVAAVCAAMVVLAAASAATAIAVRDGLGD